MTPKIRVLIADDQPLIRTGIKTLLNRKGDIEVIGQASDGAEAIRQVTALDPDVVLMDIRMPGVDGVEATRQLVAQGVRCGIIILTTFQDDQYVFSALAAGARGYLLKDVDHRVLADAVRTVSAGNALLQPEITGQVLREFSRLAGSTPPPALPRRAPWVEQLSEREVSVLRMLGAGRTNQEISKQLVISVGTVKNHISSILSKLGVRDRTQAALMAQEAGLVL